MHNNRTTYQFNEIVLDVVSGRARAAAMKQTRDGGSITLEEISSRVQLIRLKTDDMALKVFAENKTSRKEVGEKPSRALAIG